MTHHDPLHGRHELATYYFDPRFAANGVVSDHSGRGNDLSPNGGVSTDATAGPAGFGASDFDGTDDRYAATDPLGVSGDCATVAIVRIDDWDDGNFTRTILNSNASDGFSLFKSDTTVGEMVSFAYDGSGSKIITVVSSPVESGEWFSVMHAIEDGESKLVINSENVATEPISGHTAGNRNFTVGTEDSQNTPNQQVAFVGRYDLTVPTAPDAAEIARRVDELTSVPRTRL